MLRSFKRGSNKRIKAEVEETNKLNAAYIPILQRLSPGELEHANNALEFARRTVREWLVKYKFRDWETHTSTGLPVTSEEKDARAREISHQLSLQSVWHTHGRSLRIPDLVGLRLKITNYEETPDLADAIQRYHALVRMTFDRTTVYKLFETPATSLALQFELAAQTGAGAESLAKKLPANPGDAKSVLGDVKCQNCGKPTKVQLDFAPGVPRNPAAVRYPASGETPCPSCGRPVKLAEARAEIERRLGRKALDPQPTD
jgi:endogenous inhibitor of DNA gyrase (YacG/DUF329 family)